MSLTQKQPTSKTRPPEGKLKKEVAYDPHKGVRLAVVYVRDKQQAKITEQWRHILNISAPRPAFVEDTSPHELQRQTKAASSPIHRYNVS